MTTSTHSHKAWTNKGGHVSLKFLTPVQRHSGSAIVICKQRAEVYENACRAHPTRWSRPTRCWHQPEEVWISKPI